MDTTGCLLCKAAAAALPEVADNKEALAKLIDTLQTDCATSPLLKANSTAERLCEELAAGAVNLIPEVQKGIDKVAWEPTAVCAALGIVIKSIACEVSCCSAVTPKKPEQVHLSLTGVSSEMAVMWTTLQETDSHRVQYGVSEDNLNCSSDGANDTYTLFGWRGQLHRATMTGLSPGTTYYYKVGDGSRGSSPVFSFRTLASDAGSVNTPLRVASVADMGYGPNSSPTIAALQRLAEAGDIDLVVHDGDISYADGDQHHWDVFMRKIQPIASRVPYMVSPGNHEFLGNFTAYKKRFAMPGSAHFGGNQENMFYSLDVGGVHFVALNTESPLDVAWMTDEQLDWLRADLAAAAQAKHRWTVAFGHRPLYCSNHGGNDIPSGNARLRGRVEDIVLDAGVDLFIQAHAHDYERTWPLRKGNATAHNYSDPTAPVYVVNGAAGNREENDNPPCDQSWQPSAEDVEAGMRPCARDVSYGVMTITTDSLTWEQYASADESLIDRWTIAKSPTSITYV